MSDSSSPTSCVSFSARIIEPCCPLLRLAAPSPWYLPIHSRVPLLRQPSSPSARSPPSSARRSSSISPAGDSHEQRPGFRAQCKRGNSLQRRRPPQRRTSQLRLFCESFAGPPIHAGGHQL